MRISLGQSQGVLAALFDRMLHQSARGEPLRVDRHRSFIAAHLMGAALALVTFLTFFASIGLASGPALIACGWFLTPALIALFLSRTGRLETAHFLSATNLVGLVLIAAVMTGGISSFVIVWMVLVPLEAALSSSRRIVIYASALALLTLAGLYAATELQMLPPPVSAHWPAAVRELFTHVTAAAYAGGLALTIERLHRRSEAEVTGERERYRLLAENATDMITRHDPAGAVMFASPASEQIMGIAPQTLLGQGFLGRVLVSDRPRYLTALAEASHRGVPSAAEFRVCRTDATDGSVSYPWVEMRCRPIAAASAIGDTHLREVVAVSRDIAERKAQEAVLTEARLAAEKANQAKTLFLANMSHELRTPLNAILGFSDILSKDLGRKPDEQRNADYCRIINESGEHLLQVVTHLLDMSKIESGNYRLEIEPFTVPRLVASCIETVRPAAERKKLQIRASLEHALPELEADRRACKQMLLNLLANAVKFTGEQGEIEVRVATAGERMTFAVRDNGIGISAADIARLGEPFVQAEGSYRRRHEGTGLGLSVVKGLARLHGGEVSIDSELTKGTTVTITLPLVARAEQMPADGAKPVATAPAAAAVADERDRPLRPLAVAV